MNLNKITDNKKFWSTVKPPFANKGGKDNIILVTGEEVRSDDTEIAQKFNEFFKNCTNSLNITENKLLLTSTNDVFNGVDESIQLRRLKNNKASTFVNIPAKQLKQIIEVICEPLKDVWNEEFIRHKIFPTKLKLADISPIFKKLENTSVTNYRPISILPIASKIFERIMQKQTNNFIEKHLSPHLCGYRKGYNCQYAILTMIERWKMSVDNKGFAGGVLIDLSKAFDTINHQLLIAKLYAYGFNKDALQLILSYLNNRWHRTKINIVHGLLRLCVV